MFACRSPAFLIVRFNYGACKGRVLFFFFPYIYLISTSPPLPLLTWTLGLIRLSGPAKERLSPALSGRVTSAISKQQKRRRRKKERRLWERQLSPLWHGPG